MARAGPPSESLLGSTVAGYAIEGHLGSGGMGSVYRATGRDNQRYALKFMHRVTANATLQQRFSRESKVTFNATSPHLVPVIGSGESEWGPYIVMPLLAGKDVQAWLDEIGP